MALGAVTVTAWLVCCFLFKPSAFEATFDDNLAKYPLAASIASQDPNLREIFLRRTEAAFVQGGWVAANKALRISLAAEVEVYADDEHINAIIRAELALLRDLENKPLACRAFLFAGGMADELLQAKPDDQLVWSAHQAALQNGFERRLSGVRWTRADGKETADVMQFLGRGPIAALTPAELTATASYLDGDPNLVCSAAIKEALNLTAMDAADAARARRILIANSARIDVGKVMSKICAEPNSGWSCS
ncbi:hypothetical protein JQ616_22720 [Bradyrhizobium tropiciagri]|uniref:hypothetical protein n=1 Tax=Bradyrhizobium tropiciagri TaxID=312253 RepID=UPI001BA6ABE6|nr:hypothetical protein [Bradyrhizobium tropiciagri]MBR0897776.1 hypothetical protein [Bradyrhizobium tropiciagri]